MEDLNDLSDYEKLRLQNIARNETFLKQLGFTAKKPEPVQDITKEIKEKKRKLPKEFNSDETLPRRRSLRLQQIPLEKESSDEEEEEIAEEEKFSYEKLPVDSDGLDDHEFQIFVQLKKWRLLKSRELEIEPYSIFQNRALVEFIRRKRNDETWALPLKESEEHKRLQMELSMCWGIGPSKSRENGLGTELNNLFYREGSDFLDHLQHSRQRAGEDVDTAKVEGDNGDDERS